MQVVLSKLERGCGQLILPVLPKRLGEDVSPKRDAEVLRDPAPEYVSGLALARPHVNLAG